MVLSVLVSSTVNSVKRHRLFSLNGSYPKTPAAGRFLEKESTIWLSLGFPAALLHRKTRPLLYGKLTTIL